MWPGLLCAAQGKQIMITAVVSGLLAAVLAWAVYKTAVRAKKGGGCCGEREQTVQKAAVKDRNRKHYPYQYALTIGGMTCQNCARRVENALNGLPGVWARVDISSKTGLLRAKEQMSAAQIRDAVVSAGYTVLEIKPR